MSMKSLATASSFFFLHQCLLQFYPHGVFFSLSAFLSNCLYPIHRVICPSCIVLPEHKSPQDMKPNLTDGYVTGALPIMKTCCFSFNLKYSVSRNH